VSGLEFTKGRTRTMFCSNFTTNLTGNSLSSSTINLLALV